MWDDIVIGEPKGTKPNSAMKIFGISPGDKHSISDNAISYWVSDCIMGLGCTIYKDTQVGKMITELIMNKVGLEKLQDYIDTAILKRVNVRLLKQKIKESQEDYFNRGKEAKIREIRGTLGLPDGPIY